jgi:hypothetical protein
MDDQSVAFRRWSFARTVADSSATHTRRGRARVIEVAN